MHLPSPPFFHPNWPCALLFSSLAEGRLAMMPSDFEGCLARKEGRKLGRYLQAVGYEVMAMKCLSFCHLFSPPHHVRMAGKAPCESSFEFVKPVPMSHNESLQSRPPWRIVWHGVTSGPYKWTKIHGLFRVLSPHNDGLEAHGFPPAKLQDPAKVQRLSSDAGVSRTIPSTPWSCFFRMPQIRIFPETFSGNAVDI